MKTEITFSKYQKRGAYHWQQVSPNPLRFNAFVAARYQQVIKALPKKLDLKILDVGSGDGVLPWMIYQATKADITGIDTDVDSLEAARKKFAALKADIKLQQASGYSLPFAADHFDVVIAAEVIEHLQYTDGLVAEINRVLKPGGQVIITTPVKLADIPEDSMHVKEFKPDELQRLLNQYFTQVKVATSHSVNLRKVYLFKLMSIGRLHLEPFRWLINLWVLLTGLNPFLLSFGKNANQIAIGYKAL